MLQLGITGICVVEYVSRIIQIANEVAQQNLPRIVFHSAVFEFKSCFNVTIFCCVFTL